MPPGPCFPNSGTERLVDDDNDNDDDDSDDDDINIICINRKIMLDGKLVF